jgi:hypothetical protein
MNDPGEPKAQIAINIVHGEVCLACGDPVRRLTLISQPSYARLLLPWENLARTYILICPCQATPVQRVPVEQVPPVPRRGQNRPESHHPWRSPTPYPGRDSPSPPPRNRQREQ